MPRVTHFEISADDPLRAVRFYSEVFGWQIQKWDGPVDYWLVTTGAEDEPGINGGIQFRSQSGEMVVNTIEVDSLEEYMQKVKTAGGQITAQTIVPGVGYFAYGIDTEGNPFGIMQNDPAAQ